MKMTPLHDDLFQLLLNLLQFHTTTTTSTYNSQYSFKSYFKIQQLSMASIGEIDLLLCATIGVIMIIMIAIILAMRKFRTDFAERSRIDDARKFFKISGITTKGEPASELGQLMKRLWIDRGVQVCL